VLQYAARNRPSSSDGPPAKYGTTAHLDKGILPPWAEEQFDFRRPPVPRDKEDEFIILRGVLRADGTVDELKVHQGIQPLADQAALAAFKRWKFQPALRDAKPVEVEILVGVPAHLPGTRQ
jgi:TonB family protein